MPSALCPKQALSTAHWQATERQGAPPDWQGTETCFNNPSGVVLEANRNLLVSDDHVIREVTPGVTVHMLARSGEAESAVGQGAAARFNEPADLALEANRSLLVAD